MVDHLAWSFLFSRTISTSANKFNPQEVLKYWQLALNSALYDNAARLQILGNQPPKYDRDVPENKIPSIAFSLSKRHEAQLSFELTLEASDEQEEQAMEEYVQTQVRSDYQRAASRGFYYDHS